MTKSRLAPAGKLMKLEAVRGAAALYVVLHHTIKFEYLVFGVDIGELLRFGQEAVILFFLVSGFVINYSFQNSKNQKFSAYFLKRFLRIYVPLLVVFAVGFLTESYNKAYWVGVDSVDFLQNILMLQDWPSSKPGVIVDPLLNNDPLWSLSYEWWFYMLYFPVVHYLGTWRRQCNLMLIVSGVSALVYVVSPSFVPRLLMYGSIWWSGVYLSNVYMDGKALSFSQCRVPFITLAGISAILLAKVGLHVIQDGDLVLGMHPLIEFRHTMFAFCAMLFGILWRKFEWLCFDFTLAPFVVFAPVSYVIYISHYHLMTSATWFDWLENPVLIWFLYFFGLLFFAWALETKFYPLVRNRVYAYGASRSK